jgi:hypothetical protein
MSFVSAFQGPYLRFTLVCTAILLICLYFLVKRFSAMYSQLRRKWHPPSPYDPTLLRFEKNAVLFWVPVVILAGLLLTFAVYLSGYRYIGLKAQPAGTIVYKNGTVQYSDDRGNSMNVKVSGGRFAAGGIFFRFPKWTNSIGLGTYEKIITFRSADQGKYHYQPPDAGWLADYGADKIFVFLYKFRDKWKFPETFYVESPYFSGGKRLLFVTRSGYIVG